MPYCNTNLWEFLLSSKIFIESEVDQTNLKLGVMITWVNSMCIT